MSRVTLLTKADCHLCEQAKEVLERVRGDHELVVETIAVETSRGQELARTSGMVFPPAVLIDGEPFSYGRLSEGRLRKRLAQGT